MNAFVAVRSLRTAINNGTVPWSRYASSSKVPQQKQSKGQSSSSSSGGGVEIKNSDPPSNIFKKVNSKDLGPGASKEGEYKNAEYFQYHQMSYAEMEIVMAKLRVPQPSNKPA